MRGYPFRRTHTLGLRRPQRAWYSVARRDAGHTSMRRATAWYAVVRGDVGHTTVGNHLQQCFLSFLGRGNVTKLQKTDRRGAVVASFSSVVPCFEFRVFVIRGPPTMSRDRVTGLLLARNGGDGGPVHLLREGSYWRRRRRRWRPRGARGWPPSAAGAPRPRRGPPPLPWRMSSRR